MGFLGGSDGKESACNVGNLNLIPGSGRAPGGGNGNLLQYSCLGNSMNRGASQATVHGVARIRQDLRTKQQQQQQLLPYHGTTIEWMFTHQRGCGWDVLSVSCSVVSSSFVTPWTVAHQAPLSVGFPRQEYWSGFAISFSVRSS